MLYSKMVQDEIARNLLKKSEELGIDFRIQQRFKESGSDVLVRIKQNAIKNERLNEFTDLAFEVVVPKYAGQVRFSYPKKF